MSDDIAIVENVDVFTPIHDDPVTQGRIVACNATNDVFAMGAARILSLQAFAAYPEDLDESIVVGVLRGMSEFMRELGASVTGGQTITNPCPVFGGIALGMAHPKDIVYSGGAQPGDVVILTKPLGIQPAMRSYRDLKDEKRDKVLERFNESDLIAMQEAAVSIMTKSNLEVAQAMNEVGVNAATDVTGFGLLGHAGNVSALSNLDVILDVMPVIRGTLELAKFYGHKLAQGLAAETAGGMLVFLDASKTEEFASLLERNGLPCWTVGQTEKPEGAPTARLTKDVEYVETEFP